MQYLKAVNMVYPIALQLSFEQNCKPFESYLKTIFNFLASFAKTKINMKTPNSKFNYISILYFVLISIMIVVLLIYIV